jgi:hypothetical protein
MRGDFYDVSFFLRIQGGRMRVALVTPRIACGSVITQQI